MVRSRRLELPQGFPHSDLNAARLPIPPRPHNLWFLLCDSTLEIANLFTRCKDIYTNPTESLKMPDQYSPMTRYPFEWKSQNELVEYEEALQWMDTRVKALQR